MHKKTDHPSVKHFIADVKLLVAISAFENVLKQIKSEA